jgi:hypothetical protein
MPITTIYGNEIQMATLSLVYNQDNVLALHSTAHSKNAEFSIFDIDGSGSGDPFDYGSSTWTAVEGTEVEYDSDDDTNDSFWDAQQSILKDARQKSITLPMYLEIWQ